MIWRLKDMTQAAHVFAFVLLTAATTLTPGTASAQSSDAGSENQNINRINQQFDPGGLLAVHSDAGAKKPQPPQLFTSNCGPTCNSYDHTTGRLASGTVGFGAPGETWAVSFVPTTNGVFTRVIAPTSCFEPLGNNTCNYPEVEVKLFADCTVGGVSQPCPGPPLRSTVYAGPIPIWPAGGQASSAPITYHRVGPPYTLHTHTKYWICEQINPAPTYSMDSVAWMLSNSDTSPDLYYNLANSCSPGAGGWTSLTGYVRPAFAVR